MPEPVDPKEFEAKLNSCVPWLMQVAHQWEAAGLIDAPLLIAAATPQACMLVRGDGWPIVNDEAFTAAQAAAAVIEAVNSEKMSAENSATIAAGVAILLKAEGRTAHLQEVTHLRSIKMIPVVIAMLADPETLTITTAGVPQPTVH